MTTISEGAAQQEQYDLVLNHDGSVQEGDSPVASRSRMSVVQTLYFNVPHGQPVAMDSRKGTWLDSEEQPLDRTVKIGEQWEPINWLWLIGHGIARLAIENQEGRFQRIPTPGERAVVMSRVIVIGQKLLDREDIIPVGIVPPDQMIQYVPAYPDRLFLRCEAGGQAKIRLVAIPK